MNARIKRLRLLAAAASISVLAVIGGTVAATAAHAAVTTVTATTHVTNRPDGGHAGTWAYDDFLRTLTVTQDAVNPVGTPAGDNAYTATIVDKGVFHAIVGAGAPNQVVAGVKVAHSVSGVINGTYSYTVVAPIADGLTGVVPANENDNFGTATNTTGNWPTLAFATPANAAATGGAYNWTYNTACEQWVDSSTNGDGNLAGDGNITGAICAHPVAHVYDVGTSYLAPTREVFSFKDTLSGYVKVVISGPGPIGGHTWLIAVKSNALNTGVITGLTSHRDYTLLFTPANVHGHQIPGTHTVFTSFTS